MKRDITKIKKILIEQRQRALNSVFSPKVRTDLIVSTDDLADEHDHASAGQVQDLGFSLKEKEKRFLADIDEALARIEDGTYGLCEDCEEPIEPKRLEVFPTARLCLTHQEEAERRAKQFVA